jgi:hypothetical protein
MVKVVHNCCYGGFSLSQKARARLAELGLEIDKKLYYHGSWQLPDDVARHDLRLVQVVEELDGEASGSHANLRVTTLGGNRYRINEYDGHETVVEPEDLDWIVVTE